MPNTLELRAGPHRATVRVGDVVPMTDGTKCIVIAALPAAHGAEIRVNDFHGGEWFCRESGTPLYGSANPSIDIAALASQQPPADIAAIEKAAYQRGWNDREDDFIAGVERIVPPEHRTPAVTLTAAQVAEIKAAWAELHARIQHMTRISGEPFGRRMRKALTAAGLLEDAP
jgi:hypothetical protein